MICQVMGPQFQKGRRQRIIPLNFPNNCMKMKKIILGDGRER